VEAASEAYRLVTIGAREGINTELEVLDARAARTAAQGIYYEALYRHIAARLSLQRAMGILGPPPGTEGVPPEPPDLGVIDGFMSERQIETQPAGRGEVPAS
jgi:hypothetical protein